MNQSSDESLHDTREPVVVSHVAETAEPVVTAPRPRSSNSVALMLSLAALLGAGYATWRSMVIERGDANLQADLGHRLDGIDARVAENERRAAQNNALAATLRDQLGENTRLRDRMREDLLALSDRSARAEALLGDLSHQQHGARDQLALADAHLMLAQADVRLRLFGDRQSATTALALATAALDETGPRFADLRNSVADAQAALAADPRPSVAMLLTELDDIAQLVDSLDLRIVRDGDAATSTQAGWWSRQFDRLDHLVTIRRESDDETGAVAPTKASARDALTRARLAALEQNGPVLASALARVRASINACCDAQAAAPGLARLDRLIALNWQAPQPDLGALRQRLDERATTDAAPLPAVTPNTPANETPPPAAQEETT